MKSKTSLFNRTVFTNTLRRYWLLFFIYGGILGFALLTHLANVLHESAYSSYVMAKLPYYGSLLQLMEMLPLAVVFPALAAPVISTLLFSFLYNARHTGMMASLPVKRETMYLSVSAAAFAGVTAMNVLVLLAALLMEVIFAEVHLGALGIFLAVLTLSFLTFFGMSTFCCMLTGNILAGPAVYFIFNFLAIGVEAMVQALATEFVYGFKNYAYHTEPFSPMMYLANRVHFNVEYIAENPLGGYTDYTWTMNGMGLLAVYAVIGLVILGLGLLLYQHRRMETAGDTVAIEILKPVFRFCMTVGAGLVFAVFVMQLLYDITPTHTAAAAYIAVLLIIGGVIGYFVSKMLIEKTVSVFRSGWKTVGLYAVCVLAVVFSMEFDLYGYERRVPKAQEVEQVYVSLSDGINNLSFREEENIAAAVQLHSNILANRQLHEAEYGSPHAKPVDFSEPGAEYRKTYINFVYTLRNGDMLERSYRITWTPEEIRNSNSEIWALERLINTDEAIACRYTVDFPITVENLTGFDVSYTDAETFEHQYVQYLSREDMVYLYNECLLPDIAEGNMGYINLVENEDYAKSKYRCTIDLNFYQESISNYYGGVTHTGYRYMQFYPTLDAHRTMAFLKEKGIVPATVYDAAYAEGLMYCELGSYSVNGDEKLQEMLRYETTEATSTAVIGGADGPTAIYVTD